jgi:hypothetical protein
MILKRHMVTPRTNADADQPEIRNAAGEGRLSAAAQLREPIEAEEAVDAAAQRVDEFGDVAGDDVVFFAEAGESISLVAYG